MRLGFRGFFGPFGREPSVAIPVMSSVLPPVAKSVPAGVVERIASVDAERARRDVPALFAAWEHGVLQPFWLTIELDRCGFWGAWVDEAVGVPESTVDLIEAGAVYPGWVLVCKLAALVDVPLERLLVDDPAREHPDTLERCGGAALERLIRSRYAPAIVAATVNGDESALAPGAAHERYPNIRRSVTVDMPSSAGASANLIERLSSGEATIR